MFEMYCSIEKDPFIQYTKLDTGRYTPECLTEREQVIHGYSSDRGKYNNTSIPMTKPRHLMCAQTYLDLIGKLRIIIEHKVKKLLAIDLNLSCRLINSAL